MHAVCVLFDATASTCAGVWAHNCTIHPSTKLYTNTPGHQATNSNGLCVRTCAPCALCPAPAQDVEIATYITLTRAQFMLHSHKQTHAIFRDTHHKMRVLQRCRPAKNRLPQAYVYIYVVVCCMYASGVDGDALTMVVSRRAWPHVGLYVLERMQTNREIQICAPEYRK